jgi:hypothetical protein
MAGTTEVSADVPAPLTPTSCERSMLTGMPAII